jgi:hypothetical protein
VKWLTAAVKNGWKQGDAAEVYKTRWAAKPVWQPLFHQKPSKIKETTVFFQNLNYKFYEQKLINRSVFN